MRETPYVLCDVFTDRPLTGNALAVFTHADELDGGAMQALARETNLSESAFVLRPTDAAADEGGEPAAVEAAADDAPAPG